MAKNRPWISSLIDADHRWVRHSCANLGCDFLSITDLSSSITAQTFTAHFRYLFNLLIHRGEFPYGFKFAISFFYFILV
jgi:hypothetical protein